MELQAGAGPPRVVVVEVGRGTGQGLAIARTIVVDRHAGSIAFDTARERGTTFRIQLPLDVAAQSGEGGA